MSSSTPSATTSQACDSWLSRPAGRPESPLPLRRTRRPHLMVGAFAYLQVKRLASQAGCYGLRMATESVVTRCMAGSSCHQVPEWTGFCCAATTRTLHGWQSGFPPIPYLAHVLWHRRQGPAWSGFQVAIPGRGAGVGVAMIRSSRKGGGSEVNRSAGPAFPRHAASRGCPDLLPA